MNIEIRTLEYQSAEHTEMIELRDEILRKPLGLTFTADYLAQEKEDILLGAYLNKKIVGALILSPQADASLKMRQVAVDNRMQGKGIGALMLDAVQNIAKEERCASIWANVRAEAVPFYQKAGYQICSEVFTEVGIDHYKMAIQL